MRYKVKLSMSEIETIETALEVFLEQLELSKHDLPIDLAEVFHGKTKRDVDEVLDAIRHRSPVLEDLKSPQS